MIDIQFTTGDALARRFWNLHRTPGLALPMMEATFAEYASWDRVRPVLVDAGFTQELRPVRQRTCVQRLMWVRGVYLEVDGLKPDIAAIFVQIYKQNYRHNDHFAFLARYASPGPWDAPVVDTTVMPEI